MADLLQCVPDDSLADLVQAVYNKQLEEYEQVETEMKRKAFTLVIYLSVETAKFH